MIARCTNPKDAGYKRYGGRGITVCARWRKFVNFYADMGPRTTPSHCIERIDNDAGYTPQNCKWATRLEQQNNMSRNRVIAFRGIRMTVAQAAREIGVGYSTMKTRYDKGLNPETGVRPV